MAKIFNQVAINRPKSNVFDLSHRKTMSVNMGDIVPVLCEEVLPFEKWRMSTENLTRLQALVAPMMHKVDVTFHSFFVPNRLLFDNWEEFITGGDDGISDTAFPVLNGAMANAIDPTQAQKNFGVGGLCDFMGIGSTTSVAHHNINLNALPFRAYQMIYNEYYRDENLVDEIPLTGSEVLSNQEVLDITTMRKRAWEKDYFTSALPFAQKGPAVGMPFSASGDVVMNPNNLNVPQLRDLSGVLRGGEDLQTGNSGNNLGELRGNISAQLRLDPNDSLITQFNNIDSLTIKDLRSSLRLQEWFEKNARGGTRYIEQMLSHFGAISSDQRLQRPEYLGGGKSPVVISEVLQTSATEETATAQGNMAGHGIGVGNTHNWTRRFEEHGIILTLMSIMPSTQYFQGTKRLFLKRDKFDFFWPQFAHLGEQEIKNEELFAQHQEAVRDDVFGYTPRYAEYRFINDSVHGDFKTSLKYWTMAREFETPPVLNGNFITSDPTKRVFAVTDPNQTTCLVQLYHNIKAIRPLPVFGTPIT